MPLLSDITTPCESEGSILFQDSASQRYGFFDSTGHILIPARFMDAGSFHGGYAVVLPEGKRLCGDGNDDCGNPDPVDHPVFEVRSLDPGGLILRSIFFVGTPQGFRIAEVD